MRHQIRAMLHQLAETGRLGTPSAQSDDGGETDLPKRPHGTLPERTTSTLRKAQASAAQQQG